MTRKTYGYTEAPAWDGTGNEKDKGTLRLFGCFVKNINTNIGWGESASSCELTLVEEFDSNGNSLYTEPLVGQAVRVCIPNDDYPNNPDRAYKFIGIVDSFENSEAGSGKIKTLRLKSLKEVLKNILVWLEEVSATDKNLLEDIPNITYAYKNYNYDSDNDSWVGTVWEDDSTDIATIDRKGLIIKAIQDEVESKTYTFFKYDASNLQRYSIDMSQMFATRSYGASLTNKYTSNVLTEEDFEETGESSIAINDHSSSYDSSQNNKFCSEYFRIPGHCKSLSEIIEEAMAGNACDWYVDAYEVASRYSLKTEPVNGEIKIRIIPIPRNDFDDFTTSEFDSFVDSLDNVLDSKKFGKELNNEESNRVFFGSNKESLYRTDATKFNQFWGFKKTFDGDEEAKVIDRYGKTITLKNDIYDNPTFDTSSISKLVINEDLYSKETLLNWATTGLGYTLNDIRGNSKEYLARSLELAMNFDNEYEFNLDNEFNKTEFELLSNCLKTRDDFHNLLKSIFDFGTYYDKYGGERTKVAVHAKGKDNNYIGAHRSSGSKYYRQDKKTKKYEQIGSSGKYLGNRFSSINICRKSGTVGKLATIGRTFSGNFTLTFTHSLSDSEQYYSGADPDKTRKKAPIVEIYWGDGCKIYERKNLSSTNPRSISINLSDAYNISLYKDNKQTTWRVPQGLSYFKIIVRSWAENYLVEDIAIVPFSYNGYQVHNSIKSSNLFTWARRIGANLIDMNNYPYPSSNALIKNFGMSKDSADLYDKGKGIIRQAYINAYENIFSDRLDQLYQIVKNYIEKYKDRQFYRKITNRKWLIVDQAWDGKKGKTLPDSRVRGRFIDKTNGKMPCLYYVENANMYKITDNNNNLLYINNDGKNPKKDTDEISLFGKAKCRMYAVGKDDVDEGNDTRYAIIELESTPQFKNQEMELQFSAFQKDSEDLIAWDAGQEFVKAMKQMEKLGFMSNPSLKINLLPVNYELKFKVTPKYFYIPLMHEIYRYGPWILDGRSTYKNRSCFGKTTGEVDNELNPWTFKSSNEVQDYIEYQYGNCLSTEYRFNRGYITCKDIPRYNIGYAVGKFANISSINITYGADGVSTIYSMATIGASERAKEERKTQKITKWLKNIDKNVKSLQDVVLNGILIDLTGDTRG